MSAYKRKRKHVEPTNIKYDDAIIKRAIKLIDNDGFTYGEAAETLNINVHGMRFAIIRYKRDNPEYTHIAELLFSKKWCKNS